MTRPAAPWPRLLAWGARVDGRGTLAPVDEALGRLAQAGMAVEVLEIATLTEPWDAPEDPAGRRFKSGCAPILALAQARSLLGAPDAAAAREPESAGVIEAVLIRGEEPLRTGYPRDARRAHMAIWPGTTIPEAYTELARFWMERHGVSPARFRALADALLANYQITAQARGLPPASVPSRSTFVTDLFTLADCAHPEVDFAGAVLLGTGRAAEALGLPSSSAIRLRALAVEAAPDGPAHAAGLAGYSHLSRAFARLEDEARGALGGAPLSRVVREGRALLEAYTCFPVVPLAFLLHSGIVSAVDELAPWLAGHEITVTGGMNLARAPWNNPVLHALVVMADRLLGGGPPLGLVHGNGGLGGWQGLALLARGEP